MSTMSESDEISGAEVRSLRKRLGLTQEQFAHALEVTFSTVNRWENGHARPRKLTRRMVEALLESGGVGRKAVPLRNGSAIATVIARSG